ncbi:unnamed protein product [Tetraodon nigroviridis]|uniref:Chromosome 21 SCAF14577, whole genome shotgun sequence n=1 Tax=Tetraodon nigroviridis TaxID=99883 RepID=Q4SIR8_TETNG|nr:unnamed protein product [Tetraodon nigroviridis]
MTQSEFSFIGAQMNNFGLIQPYLKEMDDLLKSCEELTSFPSSSHFSEGCNEMGLMESTNTHRKGEDGRESYEEKNVSQQGYLFTRYIDTNMDGAGAQDKTPQADLQVLASVGSRCGVSSDMSCQREMPLTSAGHKLSDTMAEYEGQLSGMLSMLESCLEEAGMDFEPQDWVTDASQEYVHISKNHQQGQGTTQATVQRERTEMFKSEMMKSESEVLQDPGRAHVFKERGNEEPLEIEKTDKSPTDPLSLFSDASFNNGSRQREVPKAGDVTGIEADGQTDLRAVGSQMEKCIQEVQQLEEKRKILLQEVLELRRQKGGEKTEGCREEVTEESTERQEELESLVLQLTEQVSQLHTAHQQQISELQAVQTQMSSQTPSTQDELTECRRHSCGDIQQFLQGELRALEDRFEPILLALLKRREVTAEALVKAKVQSQELRTQLSPLKDEIQKLKLQRACLEEKLKLTHIQRTEDMEHYKVSDKGRVC